MRSAGLPEPGLARRSGPFERAARYENGESVAKDYHRALQLYCEAARDGDTRAFLALAWLYLNARGVPRDDGAAAFWLRKAANRHVLQAVNLLRLVGPVTPAEHSCHTPADALTAPAKATSATAAPPAAVRQAIDEAAQDNRLSTTLVRSIARVESAFHPAAVSPKGAVGVMQLMPATARRFQVADRFDYRDNIRGGVAYLRMLLRRYGGKLDLALAAYNAGEGAVATYRGVPPFQETQAFVRLVKEHCGCEDAISFRDRPAD